MDWTKGLSAVGCNYYAGMVVNVDEILEFHKLQTRSCFGTRSSVTKKLARKLEVQDNTEIVNLYTRIDNT